MSKKKISQLIPDFELIDKYTPIKTNRTRNLYFCRLLSDGMNTFVNQCKTILNDQNR